MKTDNYENEFNRIRKEIHEESKKYTKQEWIEKINRSARDFLADYGLKLASV